MQGIFQKENTDKALKYGIYRHLPTYEKIIRNLVSFYKKKEGQKTLEVCINAGEEPVRTGERGLPEPEDCLFANGLEHGSLRPQGVFIRLV